MMLFCWLLLIRYPILWEKKKLHRLWQLHRCCGLIFRPYIFHSGSEKTIWKNCHVCECAFNVTFITVNVTFKSFHFIKSFLIILYMNDAHTMYGKVHTELIYFKLSWMQRFYGMTLNGRKWADNMFYNAMIVIKLKFFESNVSVN